MNTFTLLDTIALALAAIHFGTPLIYYHYIKNRYLNKPWDIKINSDYKPMITIIVPTYNEAKLIEKKLDNIYEQNYPRNRLEIIVVDSASTDGTPKLVKKWAEKHPDINLNLVVEDERRGKAYALNLALKYATGKIVVVTDADSLWPDRETLRKAVKWFSDSSIGAVSCLKKPVGSEVRGVEKSYRRYYNVLRVAESKAFATPIFHGELAVFRRNLLEKLGGFPKDIGADDSYTATRIALMGYRAIVPEDLWAEELVPSKSYFWWRIRRAQHLIQSFMKVIMLKAKPSKEFKIVFGIEAFLHLLNPWFLFIALFLLNMSLLVMNSLTAILLISLGLMLLSIEQYRTWITTQLILMVASVRNMLSKELAWSKVQK
ncbi:MAG: glycosyltransferase family 2 protein [Thermoprotei archaeon]|nr:MAG: glycosyltransferase family 2 protein [Thermoprotei archaeon]